MVCQPSDEPATNLLPVAAGKFWTSLLLSGLGWVRRGELSARCENVELAQQVEPAAFLPPDLPARRLGKAVKADERDGLDAERESLGDGASDRVDHRFGAAGIMAPVSLVNHDELFLVVHLDRERGPVAARQRRVRFVHDLLDILGIELAAPDIDHVFEPAGHEELAIEEETEIAGAQITALFLAGDPARKTLSDSSGRPQ